jgi:hypothetical protein
MTKAQTVLFRSLSREAAKARREAAKAKGQAMAEKSRAMAEKSRNREEERRTKPDADLPEAVREARRSYRDAKRAYKEASPEERAAARALRTKAKRKMLEVQAFCETPQGHARAARLAGDKIFQVRLTEAQAKRGFDAAVWGYAGPGAMKKHYTPHANVLQGIESEGWKLEHIDYVFEQTGSISRDKLFSSGQNTRVSGDTVGIYLFRAVDS